MQNLVIASLCAGVCVGAWMQQAPVKPLPAPTSATQAAPEPAPALITFYGEGGNWKGMGKYVLRLGIGKGESPSEGWIFVDKVPKTIVMPSTFVTLKVTPGPHGLIASVAKKHKWKKDTVDDLDLEAEPGKHYFVRLTQSVKGIPQYEVLTDYLTLVSCEVARQEARAAGPNPYKPIKDKWIDQAALPEVVQEAEFPVCAGEGAH